MARLAVIKTGGKQYLVKAGDELYIERLPHKKGEKVSLDLLAVFDTDKAEVELGRPQLKRKLKAEILEHLKGDKIEIRRFKAKVRYRRVKGHRQLLSKIKIGRV